MRASRSPSGPASLDLYTLSAGPPALINKGYISVRLYTIRIRSLSASQHVYTPSLTFLFSLCATRESSRLLLISNTNLLVSLIIYYFSNNRPPGTLLHFRAVFLLAAKLCTSKKKTSGTNTCQIVVSISLHSGKCLEANSSSLKR